MDQCKYWSVKFSTYKFLLGKNAALFIAIAKTLKNDKRNLMATDK